MRAIGFSCLLQQNLFRSLTTAGLQDAFEEILAQYNQYKEEHAAFTKSDSAAKINQMGKFAKSKLHTGKHVFLRKVMADAYAERNLEQVCALECDIIFGRDCWDQKRSLSDLMADLSLRLNEVANDEDKIRLLLIYLVAIRHDEDSMDSYNSLKEQAFRRAVGGKEMPFEKVLANMESNIFTTHLERAASKVKGKKEEVTYGYGPARRRHTTERDGDEYNPTKVSKEQDKSWLSQLIDGRDMHIDLVDMLTRYKPTLYWLIKDLATGEANEYKRCWAGTSQYADGAVSKEYSIAKKLTWTNHKVSTSKTKMGKPDRRMLVICVLGGVTYAEIRAGLEIEARTGCKVLIGGTEVLTPSQYLERLSLSGEWCVRAEEAEPKKYDPKDHQLEKVAAEAAGKQPGGCDKFLAKLFPCFLGPNPSCKKVTAALCFDKGSPPAGGGGGGSGVGSVAAGEPSPEPDSRP